MPTPASLKSGLLDSKLLLVCYFRKFSEGLYYRAFPSFPHRTKPSVLLLACYSYFIDVVRQRASVESFGNGSAVGGTSGRHLYDGVLGS